MGGEKDLYFMKNIKVINSYYLLNNGYVVYIRVRLGSGYPKNEVNKIMLLILNSIIDKMR